MDWKKLISDLIGEGMTQAEIGQEVGLSQSVISDLLAGKVKDVRWGVGDRLRSLHTLRCTPVKKEVA